eukprot:gene825-1301_t
MPSRGKAGETQELCREGFYVEDLQCFVGESAPPKHFETYRSQAVLMFPTVEEQRDSLGAEGSITLEDFQRQLLLEDVCREDAKHWFRIMDGDGNGQLSVQEWVEAISFPAPAGAEDPSVGLVAKTSMSFEELAMRLCLHLWATVVTDLAQSSGRRAAKRMVAWFADLEEQKEALVQILTCDSLSDAHLQCVIPRLRPEDASTITNELSRLAAVSQEQGPRLEQPVKSAKWRVRPSGRAALKGRRQRGVLSVTTAVDCAARTVRERQQLAPFLQEKLPIEAGLPDWWKHLHAKTGNISDCIMVSKTTFSKGETIVVRWHLDEGCTFLGNNCVQTSLRKSLDLPVKAGDLNGTPVVALVPLNFFEDLHFTSGGGGGAYRRNDISYKDITLNPNMRAELEGWPAVKGGVLKLPVPSLKAGSEYMLQLFNTNGTTHGNVIRSAIGDPIQIAVMADSVPQAPLNLAVTETGVDYLVVRLQGPENFRHSGELAQMGVSEVCDYDFMLKAEDFVHSHTSAIGVHSFDTPGCLCNACAWMCTECAIPSQQLQAGKEQAQSYYVGVVLRDLSAKDALASQIVQRFLPPGRGDEGSPVTVCTDGALQAFIHLRPALQLPEDDSALSERTSNECRPERLISLDGGQTVSRDVAAPCTQFNVSVQARNSAGLSFPCYALLTLPLGEDLPAPTNLHAEAPAEDPSRSIKLTWSAAPRRAESSFFARVINEDGDYLTGAVQVDCSLNAVSYHVTVVEAAAADNTARSHADTREFYVHRGTELTVNRLAPLTKYRLEVRVRMRGAGWSRRAIVEAVTEDPNPDTAPLWLNTTARTSDGVTLEWAGPLSTGLAAPLEYRTLLWDPKKYRDSARQKDTRSEKDRLHLRFYTATAGTVLSAEEVSAAFVNVQVEAGVKVVPVEPQPTNSAPAKHACRFEGLSPSTGLIALVQTVTAFGPGAALLAPISTLSALDPPEGLRGGQPVLGGTGCLELRWRTPSVPPPEHLAVTCYEAELSLRGGGLDDDKVPPIVHRIPLFELGGPKAGSGSAPATGAMSTVVMGLQPGRAYSVALRAVATQRRWQGGRWGEADLPSNTTANRPAEVLSVAATARMKTAATPINAKNEKDRKAAGAARRKENWTLQFVSPNVLTWMAPERARLASYFCVQMEDSSNVSYRVHLPVDRRRCHLHLPAGSTGKVQVSAVFPSGSEETPGDLHSEYMDYWVQENAEEQIFRPPPLPPPEGVQLSCEGYSVRLSWKGGKLGGTGCTYRCLVKTQLLEIEGGADVDAAPGSFAVLDDGKKTAPLEGGDYALVIPRLNPGAAHTFTLASVAADGAVGESVTLNVSPWVDSYLLPRMAIRLQSLTADTATLQLELAGQGRFDGSASLVLTCEAVPNWRHQETVLMTRRAVVTVGGLSELGEQGHVVAEAWAVLRDNRGAVLSKGDVPGRCEFTMLASSATLASVRRPDAPEGLNAEITDSGVVRLSWEEADKSPAAKYYNVEIKAASGAVLANLRLLTDAFDLGSRERSGRLPDLVLQPGPCTIAMHGVGDTGSTSLTAHCLVQIPQRKQKSDSPSPWGQPLRKDALGARSRNGQAAGLFGNILSMKRWKKRAEGEQQEEVTGQPSLADRLGANMMGIVLAIFSLGMVALQIAALAQNMDNDYALELVAVNGAPLAVNAAVCYVFFRVNRDTPLPVWREENRAVDMMMALLSILNTEALNFYTFFVPGLRVVKLSDSHKLLDDVKRKMGSGAEEFENIVTQVKGAMGAARAKLELAVTATKSAIYEVKQAEGTIRSKTAKTAAALTVGGYAPQAKQAELDLETAVATALVKKEEAAAAAAKLMQEMAAAVAEVESILDKVIQEARDEIMKFTPPVASLRKKAEQFFDKKAGDVRETLLEEFQTLIEPIERRAGEMMEVLKKLENAMLSAQQQASDTVIAMVGSLELAKLLAQNVSEAKGALGEKLDQLMLVVDEATKKEVEEAASAEIAVAKGALTATTEAAVAKKVELEDELLVALEAANAMKAGASAALINLTDQIEIAMAEVKSTLDTALKETHAEILNARGLTIGDATATMAKQLFNNMTEEARESMVKCLREHPIKKVAETMTEALKQLGRPEMTASSEVSPKRKASFAFREPPVQITPAMSGDAWSAPATTASDGPDTDLLQTLPDPSLHRPSHRHLRPLIPPRSSMSGAANDLDTPQPLLGTSGEKLEAVPQMALAQPLQRYAKMIVHAQRLASDGDVDPTLAGDAAGQVQQWFQSHLSHCPVCEHKKPLELDAVDQRTEWLNLKNALVACLSREVPQIISLNLILYDALGSNRSPEQALEAEPSTTLALVATGMMVGIRAFQLLVFLLKSLYARLMRTRETPPSIVRNALSLSGTHNGKGVIEWDPRRVRDARGRQIRCKHFWVTWEEVGGATSGSSSRAVRVVNGDASQCTMDLVEPLLDYEVTVLGVAQKGLIRAVMKERLCIPPILVVEKTSPQSTTVAFSAAATTGSRSQCTVEVVEIGPPAAGALAVSSRTWRVPVSYDKSRGLFLASANLAPGRAYTLTVCAGTLQSLPVAVRTPALPNPPSRLEISQLASGQQQLHVYPPISMGSEDHLPVDAYRVSMRRADIREGEQELPGVGEAVLRELKALGQQVGDRLVFDAAFDSASAAGITVYEMSNLPPGASLILQVVAVNRKHETESAAAEISLTTPQSVPPERASPEPGEPGSGQPGSREEDLQKSTAEGEEATMPTMPPPRNVRVALGDVPVVLWDPAALLTGHGAAPAIEEYLVKVQWGAANGVDRPADGGTLISLPPARTSITLGELSVPVDHQQDVVVSVASRAEGHADCWSAPLRVPPSLELAKALEAPEVEVAERGTHSVLLKWRARPRRESPPQWGVLVRSVGPDESATAETVGAMLMVTNPSFSPDEWVGMADSDVHPPRGPGTLDISEAPHFTTCTVTGLEADTAYEIAVVPRGLGTSSECAAAFRPVRTLKGMSAAPIPQNGDIDPQQATHFKYPTMLEPSAVDLRGIVGKPGVAEVTWSPPSENAALVKEYLISLLPAWAHAESLEDRADRGADEGAVGSKQGDDAAAAVARMESIHFKEMTYRAVPATGLGKQRLLVENLDPEQVYVVRVQAVGWSSSAAAIAQVCDPHASLKAVDWVSTMRLGSEELATRLITAAAQRFIDLHSKQSEVDAMDVEYPLGIAILPAADLPIQLQKLLHRYTDALYESGISDDGAVQRILAVIDSHKAEVLEEAAELQKKLKSSMEGGEEGALSAAELEGILGQVHKFVVDQWRWWQKPDALAPKSEAEAEKLILEINNTLVTALGSLRNFEDVISMGTPGQLVDAWCSMIGDSRELGLQLKVGLRRALVKAEQVPQAEKDALNSVQVAVAQFDVDPEGAYTTMSDLVPRVVQVLEAQPAWVQSSPEEHAEMLRLLEKEGCIDDVQPDLLQKVVPQRYAFHSSLRLLLASAQQLRIRHEQWLEARREADGRALSAKRGLEVALGAGVPEQLLDAWEGMAAMLKDPLCEDPGLPWKLELRELLIEAGQAPQDEREALEEMEAAAAQFQMRPVEARSALQDIMPRVVRVLEAQPSWVQSSLEEHTEMVRLLEHMGGAEGAAAPEVIKKGPQHAVVFRWLFLQAVKSRHHDHTRLCDKFVSAQEQLRMAKRQAKENNATRETEEQVARALMGMDLKEAQAAVDSLREREPGHPLVKVADDMLRKERGRVVKWAELLTKRGIEAPCGSGWTNVREGGVCGFCNTAVNGDDDGFQCINGCHWLAWVHLEEKGAQHAVLVSSDRDWSFKQHYQVDLQSLVRHLEPEHLSRLVGEQTAIRRAQLRSVTGSARAKERTKRMEEQIAGVRKWQTDLGDMNAVLNHLKAFAESQPLSEAAIEKRDFLIAEERLVRALEDGNPSQIQSAAESVCEQEPAHPLVKAAEEKLEKSKVLAEEQMANTVMSSNPDEVRAALHKLEVFVKSHPLIAAGQERLEGLAAKEQLQHTLEHANSMEIQAALDRFIKHEPFHPLIKTAKGKLHESHTLAKEQMQHAMSCSNLNGMKTALDGLKAFADSQPLVESAKEIAIPLAEKQVTMAMKESASGGRAEMVAALENLQAFAEPAHPLIEAGKQELEVFCAEEKLVYTMEKVMERPKEVRAAAQSLSKLEPSHPLVRAAEETLERGKVMAQEHMVNAITSNKAKEVEQALYYLKEFTESDPFIEKGKKSLEVISAAEHLQRVMNAEEFIEMQAAVDRLSECEPSHSLVREGNERIESERLMLEEELGRGIADKNLNQMRSAMKRLKNVAASSPLIVKATKIAKPIAEQEAARTMNSNNLQEMKDALDNLEAFAGDTAHTLINATKEKLIQE